MKRPIAWEKNPRWGEKMIEHLTNDVAFRAKLFSDSTKDAKADGRRKVVGKDAKKVLHATLAKAIFANDEETLWREEYEADPVRFATSVGNQLIKWKRQYHTATKRLGKTGAGIEPDKLTEGSQLANLMREIKAEWPLFPFLHAFWREIPSYNPIGTSNAAPGQDLEAEAQSLFFGAGGDSQTPVEVDEGVSQLEETDLGLDFDPSDSLLMASQSTLDQQPLSPLVKAENPPSIVKTETQSPNKSLRNYDHQPAVTKAASKAKDTLTRFQDVQLAESEQSLEKRKLQHIEITQGVSSQLELKKLKLELDAKDKAHRRQLKMEERRAQREHEARIWEMRLKLSGSNASMSAPSFPNTPNTSVGTGNVAHVLHDEFGFPVMSDWGKPGLTE